MSGIPARITLKSTLDALAAVGITVDAARQAGEIAGAIHAALADPPAPIDVAVAAFDSGADPEQVAARIVDAVVAGQSVAPARAVAAQLAEQLAARALGDVRADADKHVAAMRPAFDEAVATIRDAVAVGVDALTTREQAGGDLWRGLELAAETLGRIDAALDRLAGDGGNVARYLDSDQLEPVLVEEGAFGGTYAPLDVAAERFKHAAFGLALALTNPRYAPAARWLALVRAGNGLRLNDRAGVAAVQAASDAALAEHRARRAA